MPGNLVHQGAVVICGHGGQAQPTVPNPRVTVGGQATVLLTPPWSVAGCPLPPVSGGPCVTGMWTVGTTRVTSLGQPLVVSAGAATCAPTGVPLTVTVSQPRVVAT
ncbi:hypothetical protein NCC78_15355 [Micromonospora phytophila]|uniref:hypothetical protein n=1 Tax=Micromonospora phytophila TaxID=709888 RepID=UPI00202F75F1|nr:hypothetical protein [Micromonospora phytophila]MCM0676057.1 hypothetical protein [Micromonospora phytophila]